MLGDPLTKLTFSSWFVKKHGCQWAWLVFPYITIVFLPPNCHHTWTISPFTPIYPICLIRSRIPSFIDSIPAFSVIISLQLKGPILAQILAQTLCVFFFSILLLELRCFLYRMQDVTWDWKYWNQIYWKYLRKEYKIKTWMF